MNIKELQNLTVKQLQKKATELGISEYIGLKKQELIKLISILESYSLNIKELTSFNQTV